MSARIVLKKKMEQTLKDNCTYQKKNIYMYKTRVSFNLFSRKRDVSHSKSIWDFSSFVNNEDILTNFSTYLT